MPVAAAAREDRVGLGWRPAISADIMLNLEEIDCLEVVTESLLGMPPAAVEALDWLAAARPVEYHGVTLGLASAWPVEEGPLSRVAAFLEKRGLARWSEHLAFVRAGGHEIGHLAMPPRTRAVIDGLVSNFELATRRVGVRPLLENIATLVEPPGCEYAEPEWTRLALEACGAELLLDLHNLYANAVNRGEEPLAYLLRFPLERVQTVHLSGGRWISEPGATGELRLLDDHAHDVPMALYGMLEELAARVPSSLRVIIERDGNFPDFSVLSNQMSKARMALRRGRLRRSALEQGGLHVHGLTDAGVFSGASLFRT
jgi:uncharacterized protein (UPF0276 family)